MKALGVLAALWALSGPARAETGAAALHATSTGTRVSGSVLFEDTKGGLKVRASLVNVPAGTYALHIHEFGSCDDAGKAAGAHYNPKDAPHGFLPKDGGKKAHAGDMGNIQAAADGTASLELVLPGVSLSSGSGPHAAGRAVILHEKPDDFSQPAGNAGERIACGVIAVTGK
ncbi:MAG TPA: superoxide dismutase family protein [Elusimicrobiota bacterium]|jgi:Cu-Zn family superoxide dismutase|nr:superoxide dismutase family protein [Elusimicrobiota bacterium]